MNINYCYAIFFDKSKLFIYFLIFSYFSSLSVSYLQCTTSKLNLESFNIDKSHRFLLRVLFIVMSVHNILPSTLFFIWSKLFDTLSLKCLTTTLNKSYPYKYEVNHYWSNKIQKPQDSDKCSSNSLIFKNIISLLSHISFI